jgi:hypothetical protein
MSEHIYAEAFKLMTYGCACGHREVIWNSRNGVTPFCIGCPSCGQMTLQHVDWPRDVHAPSHVLHKGQRFFRDGTPDEAEAIMRRRIEMTKDGPYALAYGDAEDLVRQCRDGETSEFQPGWPMIDRASE